MVAVAQLAERRAVAAKVAGSKPVGHPKERGTPDAGSLSFLRFRSKASDTRFRASTALNWGIILTSTGERASPYGRWRRHSGSRYRSGTCRVAVLRSPPASGWGIWGPFGGERQAEQSACGAGFGVGLSSCCSPAASPSPGSPSGTTRAPSPPGPRRRRARCLGWGSQGSATGSGAGQRERAPGALRSNAAAASERGRLGESAVAHGVTRSGRKAAGGAGASASSAAAAGASTERAQARLPARAAPARAPSGASQGGGQDSPPAPSQGRRPDAARHRLRVGGGRARRGPSSGLGLGNGESGEADVTIGTNQVIGDHPPSDGTGVDFGGRLDSPTSRPNRPNLGITRAAISGDLAASRVSGTASHNWRHRP